MEIQPLVNVFQGASCPQVWLQAVNYLFNIPRRQDFNVILAIESPVAMSSQDLQVCRIVDRFLRDHDQAPLTTVAGTIFPANHYLRYGRNGVYKRFPKDLEKVDSRSWGTYAMRMLKREGKDGKPMNPLRTMVEKINKHRHLNRSAYEISVISEPEDLGEIAIYDPKEDSHRLIPQPCLSHLTFKVDRDNALRLTVMYRSHYYITKALGNLIGLAQLQSFVADETGLSVGPLVCHSTHARIDTAKGLTIARIKKLISKVESAQVS